MSDLTSLGVQGFGFKEFWELRVEGLAFWIQEFGG